MAQVSPIFGFRPKSVSFWFLGKVDPIRDESKSNNPLTTQVGQLTLFTRVGFESDNLITTLVGPSVVLAQVSPVFGFRPMSAYIPAYRLSPAVVLPIIPQTFISIKKALISVDEGFGLDEEVILILCPGRTFDITIHLGVGKLFVYRLPNRNRTKIDRLLTLLTILVR